MSKPSTQSVVFFGVGQTSLEALQALAETFEIEAVITKPDGIDRSDKPKPTVVADWARKHAVSAYKPAGKAELSKLVQEKHFRSSVGVVLDYGVIIPEDVIESFDQGIINSHFSLLPKYRGADPIRSIILNGEKTTGVTIIKIVAELDAGPILAWADTKLLKKTNASELRQKLSTINCALLPETLKLYLAGTIEPISQDDNQASFSSKTHKEDGLIDPSKLPSQLVRQIHAYTGWPKSYFEQNNQTYVIVDATESDQTASFGKLSVIDGKLYFGCTAGSLQIITIQPAGKAAMDATSFINGYKDIIS
jgi:methionyl-tRNA formyltransferase